TRQTAHSIHFGEVGLEPTWHRGPGTWRSHREAYKLANSHAAADPSCQVPAWQKSFCSKERLRQQWDLKSVCILGKADVSIHLLKEHLQEILSSSPSETSKQGPIRCPRGTL
ncbi:mCG2552, isoform CRA_a, partial [Mus musculus]